MSWWSRLTGGTSGSEQSRRVNFLAEAIDLESRGDFANALTSYRLALRERPDDIGVLQNMAIAFTKTGQPEEAIRSYRRALQVDAESSGAHYGLAYLLLKRGDTAHAAMHLEGFLRNSNDDDAASHRFRAHARRTLDDLKNIGGMPDDMNGHLASENTPESTLDAPATGSREAQAPDAGV